MSQKKLLKYAIIIMIITFIIVLSIPRLPEEDNSTLVPDEERERSSDYNPFEQSNSGSVEEEEIDEEDTIDIRVID
ncbi:MAG: hypothetical protein ACLFPF_08495 [Halanaerobiales bacterium]